MASRPSYNSFLGIMLFGNPIVSVNLLILVWKKIRGEPLNSGKLTIYSNYGFVGYYKNVTI
jgi:hypothetical protein